MSKPLEIVHSGMSSLMRSTSMGSVMYFIIFIDDFPRKVWVYMLKTKMECLEKLIKCKVLVET